jgi:1-phosphofructokinase family hexose kinase
MIVTVTPNTGIDYTMAVPHFKLNATIRSSQQAWGMGGKTTDVAWILGQLGEPVRALGFAGGFTGEQMERMLNERGVLTDFTWVEGETRLNVILVCSDGSGQSTITSSRLFVSSHHLTEFQNQYLAALEDASCLVLGGSLPSGVPLEFYPQVISQARQCNIPVIFDSSGPALRAGVQACPSLIKPNRDELCELLGFLPASLHEYLRAAKSLQGQYGTDVIVTIGSEGALAVIGERSYHIPPLSLPVASSAGAGDGILAGMALVYSRGEPLENGLRYGFALAGAVLQTLATADFRINDYHALLPQITLISI